MRDLRFLAAALLLPPVLSGCAFGAYLSPMTPLERAVNGTYEGIGVGGTGRVPYRMTLTVQEREGRAAGVITNLESRKVYAASGTFKRLDQGGALEMNLFENGDKHRGNLHATLHGTKISGVLRTVLLGRELLGYTIELNQVPGAAPVVAPAAAPVPAVP
ncbi:hypothetical protein GCM10010840_01400 [Deinococcus aerolatus]|uniref:DUF3124 domain-containing protein n=1 Tax=Deinococcus aerolatus TaxID=522487 RepID=A0ABQ2FZ10_9DEIO|nr:hypothetical protein [Deinococcus aerolatus]GGL67197.1 hypothetical protein GCM10010840_01400 [Deinococcus aerolatus]